MKLRAIAASLALLGLSQCTPAPKLPPQPSFDVKVAITPEGIAALQGAGDHAVVDVYYYGFPKPGVSAPIDQIGRVRLGNELYEIKATDTQVHVTPTLMDPVLFTKVVEPYAQITVYSRNKQHSADEMLECSYYRSKVAGMVTTGAAVTCDVNKGPD